MRGQLGKNLFVALFILNFGSYLLLAQNVGIGEPSPSAKFHIRTSGNYAFPILKVDTTGATIPHLVVIPSGNVGIGITNPSAKLHINVTDTTVDPIIVEAPTVPPTLNFDYRVPITITENSGNTLLEYQVLIVVNTASLISAGKMQPDCDDIRFTDFSGAVALPYWIESGCNTANTYIWVKVPNIPASGTTTIYMYYGNPTATSQSSPSQTFIPDRIFLVTGRCTDGANCGYTDNHTEMDNIRASIGTGTYSIDGSGYVISIDHGINPYGGDDQFYMRYRFLFIPTTTSNYSFVINSDDGMEVTIFPLDGYGGGLSTGHPFGAHDVIANWYGSHGPTGGCGTGGTTGTRSLTAGQGYWFDVMQTEWFGGQLARLCVDNGTGLKTFTVADFPAQIFARRYTTPEPTTTLGTEEVISPAPAVDTVFYIQRLSGNVGIGISNPASKLAIKGLPTYPPDTSPSIGCICVTQRGNLWIDADGQCDCQ
ncbi:MAG: DUF2341 domain-containing protein [Chlorobi bacterium]|nr:DUF2341 domain-containing protein [Chlorobiota bacterium]